MMLSNVIGACVFRLLNSLYNMCLFERALHHTLSFRIRIRTNWQNEC